MAQSLRMLRRRQIRVCSRWLNKLGGIPQALRPGLRLFTGYHRPFPSLADAQAALAGFDAEGHSNPDNAHLHLMLSAKPRPSDYPALFYIGSILPELTSVFDLGGNVGNLYYCYAEHLSFAPSLVWTVYDVPKMLALGQELAAVRKDARLRFTDSWHAAEAVDLFIASGSLHYFDQPLPTLLKLLKTKPKYVLVNRTPLLEEGRTATVQDAGSFLVACNLYGKNEVLRGFESAGYKVTGSWGVDELSLVIPGYPDLSVPAYTGMFFTLQDGTEQPKVLR